MTDGSRVAELLSERPDLESPLEDVLAVDERSDTWTFDDVPIDSGHFGELVSRDVVEKVDDQYQLTDPNAVRSALGEEPTGGARDGADEESEGSFSLSASTPSVEPRAAGMLMGVLAFMVVIRSYVVGAVFRGEHVVLASNDPYYYRYWVEQLLSTGESLAAVGGPIKGEPLMIATLARIADLVGGMDAAGVVLAIYPVVAAVLVGLLLYLFTMRLAADRRVALAAVVMLAITPSHALRTALGFADHHAFDYIWLVLTALALLVLVDGNRLGLRDRTTVLGALGLGMGIGGQILAWDNGALLVVPVAAVVAGYVLLIVQAGRSPGLASMPFVVGLVLATAITLLGHVGFGWHSPVVAALPVVFLAGTIGVVVVGEIAFRLGRPARELAVAEGVVAIIAVVGTFLLVPDLWDRVRRGLGLIGRTDDIAEVAALFSGETMGFVLLFGFVLVVALPMLILLSVRPYRGDETWLVPVVYTWYFFGLSLFQVRFVGEVAAFTAVFAGLGFVWLAAKVDVAAPPAPFDGELRTEWTPDRPDSSTVFAVVALFLLVGGLGMIQSGVKIEQITIEDETYETAAWMAAHADERGRNTYKDSYVFSDWGQNRLFNYFVNGQSDSYRYAQRNYEDFLNATDEQTWYKQLTAHGTGFIVTESRDATGGRLQARLHNHYGSQYPGSDGVSHFRAIYASADETMVVFQPVEGAIIVGNSSSKGRTTVKTDIEIPNASFTYQRQFATQTGEWYAVRIPYPGNYTMEERNEVTVTEEDIAQGQFANERGEPAYWPFDQTRGGVLFDHAGGNHGTIQEGSIEDGIRENALSLNGSYARVDEVDHLGNDDFTLSIAFKTAEPGVSAVDNEAPRLAARASTGSLSSSDGYQLALVRGGLRGAAGNGSDAAVLVGPKVDDGEWHHVAVVRNRTSLHLYLDGERIDSANFEGDVSSDSPLYFGTTTDRNRMFKGALDEARHYNRPLSEKEIRSMYETMKASADSS